MHKERECEEVAILDGVAYKFAGTFGFLEKLELKGRDPAFIYDDLASGMLPPTHIRNTLSCSLEAVDGKAVTDKHDEVIGRFIEAAGLIESSMVARHIMSHGMVGSVKKKQIRQLEEVERLSLKSKSFFSRNSKRAGLLLVAICLISIGLACMNSSV